MTKSVQNLPPNQYYTVRFRKLEVLKLLLNCTYLLKLNPCIFMLYLQKAYSTLFQKP